MFIYLYILFFIVLMRSLSRFLNLYDFDYEHEPIEVVSFSATNPLIILTKIKVMLIVCVFAVRMPVEQNVADKRENLWFRPQPGVWHVIFVTPASLISH